MGARIDPESLIEAIYRTVGEPGAWTAVLEGFADLMGAEGALLMWSSQLTGAGSGLTARLDPAASARFFGYYAARNPLRPPPSVVRRMIPAWAPRVITDETRITKAQLMRTEFYNDFMRPFDMHSTLTVGLAVDAALGGDIEGATIDVIRSRRRGSFDEADVALARDLQAHLVRAFGLSRKLADGATARDDLAGALDGSVQALIVLDDEGRVRHANVAADALLALNLGLAVVGGRLVARQDGAARRLEQLIGEAASQRVGGEMALTPAGRTLPLLVSIAPIGVGPDRIFRSRSGVLVCVTDLETPARLSAHRLRALFDLSRAEIRIALALYDGRAPKTIADELALSIHTVRGHLARVFDKTGVRGQVELIRLLARLE